MKLPHVHLWCFAPYILRAAVQISHEMVCSGVWAPNKYLDARPGPTQASAPAASGAWQSPLGAPFGVAPMFYAAQDYGGAEAAAALAATPDMFAV